MDGLRKVRAGAVAMWRRGRCWPPHRAPRRSGRRASEPGTPWGQTGIQLYDFSSYLSNGAGEITCPAPPAPPTPNCVGPPAPTTQAARLERVFAWLQSKDIRNVELYGYPGNPFPGTTRRRRQHRRPAGAEGDRRQVRPALPGRHGNLNENNWDNQIAASRILGQTHLGESGLPGNTNGYNTWDRAAGHRAAAEPPRQALGGGRPRPGVLPQPQRRVQPPLHGRRRELPDDVDGPDLQELVGAHHGPHRSALGRRADRHRLGRLRLGVRHPA